MMRNLNISTCSKVVLAVLLAICWTADAEAPQSHHTPICGSYTCLLVGSDFYASLNKDIKACNDFYDHACDVWTRSLFPVEVTSPISITTNSLLTEIVRDEVHALLKDIKPDDIEAVVKAKKLLASCEDEESIRRQGMLSVIQPLISTGDWPLSVTPNRWNPMSLTWQNIHETIVETQAVSALFDIDVEINREDSTAHILLFTVPEVPSRRGKRDVNYSQYLRKSAEFIKSLRSPKSYISPSAVENDIQDLLAFEGKLAKLTTAGRQTDKPNDTEHRVITIETLQKEWDETINAATHTDTDYSINWLEYISERFRNQGVAITKSEQIALRPGDVPQKLADLLTKTPARIIVNYIQWKMIHSLLPLTSHGLEDYYQWNLDDVAPLRRHYCVEKHPMPHAINYVYSKAYLNETTKAAARDMVNRIREEFKLEASPSGYISDNAKDVFNEKLDRMKIIIGHADWSSDIGKLNEYYDLLTVGDDYFENMMAYRRFNVNRQHARLRRPVSDEDIPFEFFKYRGHFIWYDYQTNALTIGAQNFQKPMYMENRPTVLNFAVLGTMIAHEMAHSIDPIGRLYDQYGNKVKFWEDGSIHNYNQQALCFARQFGSYTLDTHPMQTRPINVNSDLTHEENISDTEGVRVALKAYQKMRAENKTRGSTLPVFNEYTSDEVFFYGYANSMCESISRLTVPAYYENSKRTPHRFRVNVALKNMKEFSETFGCAPTDPMNPPDKCLLWH